MKKITLAIFILLAVLLAGCGTGTGSPTTEALPSASRLVLGTFRLEETDQAVTEEEAAELLPLWQVYRSLSSSGTAAQEEIDALVQQIQETMTPSQVQTIEAMNLTRQDISSVISDQEFAVSAARATTSDETATSGAQGGSAGGMPPTDMGGGDPSMGMGGPAVSSSDSGSNTSEALTMATSSAIPTALLDALIQLLQNKIA